MSETLICSECLKTVNVVFAITHDGGYLCGECFYSDSDFYITDPVRVAEAVDQAWEKNRWL